ncbi:hypothetical protein BCR41DRAFT_353502 [Lobosporangium transversale]|uniref:Uncharacterized protein n=1 Tax=Lobosporangium transversale TaxID=64571 RepID=A0A1Y2GMU6_9FUNG|nr:hypothetical protein BCR41DRAFT_353502 [Lobosporangium transversale]ORZ16089.1 hypothetical protein BCR41DRAFT_353502 [Lobosporangium transversale]|eukprot:XP_021881436.1 hypothetical protein BCR41DRAFT_353502 [Lobosporangium transversale]
MMQFYLFRQFTLFCSKYIQCMYLSFSETCISLQILSIHTIFKEKPVYDLYMFSFFLT